MPRVDEVHAVNVELLQESADAGNVALIALLDEDFADFLARECAVVANVVARPHLLAVFASGWSGQFHYLAVTLHIAHRSVSRSGTRCGSSASRWLTISRTIGSASSCNSLRDR